jgi:putative transposase
LALKKSLTAQLSERRRWIEPHPELSVVRQCALVNVGRSGWYYEPVPESEENLELMRQIDVQYLKTPFYGSRRMAAVMSRGGTPVNRKRVQRLMRTMGLEAIYPRRTSARHPEHEVYPYLLKGMAIVRPNQVWSADITYVPMRRGFLYLVALIDWFSRYVLAWQLSNCLDTTFCLEALEMALDGPTPPEYWNSDQGAQFTAKAFLAPLKARAISISMDGRGRALDNIFVERLWRTVKYEEIYLKDYQDGSEAYNELSRYFQFYNTERPHQSLGYKTPREVYHA